MLVKMPINSSYCQIASFFIGVAKICYMAAPVGQCGHCCQHNDAIDIQYKLFTRNNPVDYQVLPLGDVDAIRNSSFDLSRPTVIYLFGFSEATDGASSVGLRNAHLKAGDYNFIGVDWSRLIAFPWYITAVRNTVYMGNHLARFVMFLGTIGVEPSSLQIIGFSLGAEAAGFAGKSLKARGILVGRITGLDPALPGYSLRRQGHLSKGDALFVDVIHTNPGVFGIPLAIGDVDFFPNYGEIMQPGCRIDQLISSSEFAFFCK